MIRVLLLLFGLTVGLAFASSDPATCRYDFERSLAATLVEDAPLTGRAAAALIRSAVELLEPVLPALVYVSTPLPVDLADPDEATARYLAQRSMLPVGWHPDVLPPHVWNEMLGMLGRPYGLPTSLVERDLPTVRSAIDEVASTLQGIASRLRPVALIASDSRDSSRVAFWALVQNGGSYPRLVIMRPPDESVSLRRGVQGVLPFLSSCALSVERYVFAPERTASSLFLSSNLSRMVIVETDVVSNVRFFEVPAGREMEFFGFTAPELEGVGAFSAVFPGPPVGMMAVMRMLPSLRTNMGPREIYEFLQSP